MNHLLCLYWICYHIIFFFFYVLFFGLEAWGILVPLPGMEPTPPALEGEALTIGQPDRFFNECGNELNSYMSRWRCISQASMGDGWHVDAVMRRMFMFLPNMMVFGAGSFGRWFCWDKVMRVEPPWFVVRLLSRVWLFNPMDYSTPSFPVLHISWSLHRLMSMESVMPSNHLILCHPFLLLASIFPSIRVFSNESVLWIKWPKYWSFSFSISPSSESSGLISFRMDWFDLAVQGTLKSLLQHHSSKTSVIWCSAFFMVWLISVHDYWKNNSFD